MGFLNGKSETNGASGATHADAGPDPSKMTELVGDGNGGGTADELDTVRELLFGVHMSKLREDMDLIHNRVAEQSGEMRDVMARRLESFERSIEKRLDKMEQRLAQEASQRLEAYGQLTEKLTATDDRLDTHFERIEARVDERHVDLTKQLHGQGKLFAESIRRNCQELSAHFEREAEAAAKARADRASVAQLLMELSKQLDRDDLFGAAAKTADDD